MTNTSRQVRSPRSPQKHDRWEFVRYLTSRRDDAARAYRELFPSDLADYATLPQVSRTSISRARSGHESNPLWRLESHLAGLAAAGEGRERAMLALLYIEEAIDLLWDQEDRSFTALSLAEQREEGRETEVQMEILGGDLSPEKLRTWIEHSRRERALLRQCERAARRSLEAAGA